LQDALSGGPQGSFPIHFTTTARNDSGAEMSDAKLYASKSIGEAAFIYFVTAGEDTFSHVEIDDKSRPVIWFTDEIAKNPCSELAELYHSGTAVLRNVKEFATCYADVAGHVRRAYRDQKKS
jgi:hypothetical protein